MRPMREFDPTKPALVHDALNDRTFKWKPEFAESYRKNAKVEGKGIVGWDGLRLDGWEELGKVLEFRVRQKSPEGNGN